MGDIESFLADLDDVLVGPLTPFRAGLAARGDGIGLDELLDERHVARILAWYDDRLGASVDRRPALSIWMGWHFQSVLPPILAAHVLLDRCPNLDPTNVTFTLSAEHKAVGLVIGPDVRLLSLQTGPARFEGLVRFHLAPLIAHAVARTGLTPRVFWSNAGHVFERLVGKLEAEIAPRPSLSAARELLTTSAWPDGAPNMLDSSIKYVEGRRLRRVCCMRYLFPDGRICAVCPIRSSPSTRQTVHA